MHLGDAKTVGERARMAADVADDVVGGEERHHRLRIAAGDGRAAEHHRAGGIAADGLDDEVPFGKPRHEARHRARLRGVRDDPDALARDNRSEAIDRHLDERLFPEKREELLRPIFAAARPEAFALAAGHDQDVTMGGHRRKKRG